MTQIEKAVAYITCKAPPLWLGVTVVRVYSPRWSLLSLGHKNLSSDVIRWSFYELLLWDIKVLWFLTS